MIKSGSSHASSPSPRRVLLVEADEALRSSIASHLRDNGSDLREASTLAAARDVLATEPIDAVVLDHVLPDGEAFDLLPVVFAQAARPVVIVLTACGSIDFAVRVIKAGVQQFLTKPVDRQTLLRELEQYLGQRDALAKRAQTARRASGVARAVLPPMFGPSEQSKQLREALAELRGVDGPVLLVGEVGTGKSTVARYLHDAGRRSTGSFVAVGDAALARDPEGELFGAGARSGLVEAADRGTLFLDEIATLERGVHEKLAALIETKSFRRVGDAAARSADVRVIAATKRDVLAEGAEGAEGALIGELRDRLSVHVLRVAPLRERPEDIVPLARQLLDALSTSLGRPRATLSEDAERALLAHSWPGNVRELKSAVERAFILGDGGLVLASDVQVDGVSLTPPPLRSDMAPRSLEGVEIEHIRRVLAEANGRVDAAAVLLEMPRSTLYERIRRYGIDLSELRRRKS